MFLRKYATATHVYVPMIKRGVVDYAVGADWTPAAGDVKVVIDGAVSGNIGTLPTAIACGNTALWDFTLTTGETTGKKVQITISDAVTKAVEDQTIEIETYGNASAEYQADFSAANLPASVNAIANNVITAASINNDAITAAKIADGAIDTATFASGTTIPRVTLADTLTTYTGNTPQTGDSYPVVNSGTFGNPALLIAIQNVQNGTFINSTIPQVLEKPDSGSVSVSLVFAFADETGAAKNLDSGNPAVTLVNDAGSDLSSRLGAFSNPATGKYVIAYTNSASDAIEGLHWDVTGTVNSKLRRYVAYTQVADTTAVDFTSSDRTNLNAIVAKLPSNSIADQTTLLLVTAKLPVNNIADETIVLAAIGTPMQVGPVTLAASQPNYAPAVAGNRMDLVDAPNATAVTVIQAGLATGAEITALQAHGDANWGTSVIGPGSTVYTDHIYQPDGVTPVASAEVWVSTDVNGTNVIAGTVLTDDLGAFTFMLDPGTYYLWVDSVLAQFTNPTQIVVT